jgi:hypothetical protein
MKHSKCELETGDLPSSSLKKVGQMALFYKKYGYLYPGADRDDPEYSKSKYPWKKYKIKEQEIGE